MSRLKEEYYLNLKPDGTDYSDVVDKFPAPFLNKLLEHGLIYIDQSRKVFLTERGLLAKKMGLEKYLLTERFEKNLSKDFTEEKKLITSISMVILGSLLISIAVLLLYVSLTADFL